MKPNNLNIKKICSWLSLLFGLMILLGGCTIGRDYHRPDVPLPDKYVVGAEENNVEKEKSGIAAKWWVLFDDPELVRLVELSLANNTDLQQATARIEQAVAQYKQAGAAFWPSVDIEANANRYKSGEITGQADAFKGLASASYEIDFWGKLRRASESARAQTLSSRYAAEVVRQTVASAVAHGYFGIMSTDLKISITKSILRSLEEDVRMQRLRFDHGVIGRLDLEQSEGQRAEAAVQVRELERQRALMASQLGLLTGQPGINIKPMTCEKMVLPPVPPVGLPSRLLERRPDVQQAEQQLISAQAEVGVAKAMMFPNISLTAFGGSENRELSDLFKSGTGIWSLGFGLNLPIFDAGRRMAATEQADARQVEALAAYQGAVQSAFKDVLDALANLQTAKNSLIDAEAREKSALLSLELAKKRYSSGYSAYLEILDAQRTWNTSQLQTVTISQSRFDATVDLLKSLGGGWTNDNVFSHAL